MDLFKVEGRDARLDALRLNFSHCVEAWEIVECDLR